MNCQQSKPLIDLYADGELEAAAIRELEQHIKDCPSCAAAWRNLQSLKKAFKHDSLYFEAPSELRRRIKSELRSTIKTEPQKPAGNWVANWNWLTTALSGATAACLALLLFVMLGRPSSEQSLAQQVASSHIRSLMENHLMDVASTDQHTVKPWFNGKVDFSPPVKNLETNGFPLIGGRLDYLNGHSVAALVFQRQKHIINVFVWPSKEEDSKATPEASQQGYNLIHWTDAGMTFWAASDLNKKELMEFAQDFAVAAPQK